MILNVNSVKELTDKKGWSERELARYSGLSNATISRVFAGKMGAGTRSIIGIRKAFPNEPIEKLFFYHDRY